MPATVRDILLMIRAKEEATRTLNKVAGSMRGAAAAAESASARSRAAALRAQAQQAKLNGATKAQVAALNNSAQAWDNHAKSIDKANKKSKQFAENLQSSGQIMQTAGISLIALGAAGVYGMGKAVQAAADWDKQVRLTFTQVDRKYKPSLQELSNIGMRVSKDIAVPFETIQSALFDVFSSTEANMPQAEALLRSFAKAAVAGQTDVQTASRATIGLMNAFKIPFTDVNKLLDIQFQLVQEGVGTYEEWANRIGLVSPSAVRAGQSIETMAAALSTATRLGMNAARASTSVARAFDAMSNPKVEKNLKKLGIASRDAKGQFRPMVDVLADWKKQLDKLPEKDKVAEILDVLKGAGGTIEARRFLQQVLMSKGGLQLFQDQVKEFATDKGAFVSAYNDMAASVSSKTTLLKTAWDQLKVGIGQALMPTFTMIVDKVKELVDWFNKLPASSKQAIANFLLWGSALAIVGGGLVFLVGMLVSFAGIAAVAGSALLPMLGVMLGVAAGAAVLVAGLVGLGYMLVQAYKKSAAFRLTLTSIKDFLVALGTAVKDAAMKIWNAISSSMIPAFKQVWTVIQGSVLPTLTQLAIWAKDNLVPVIKWVGNTIATFLKPAFDALAATIKSQVIPMIQELNNWWQQNKDVLLPVAKAIAYVIGFFVLLALSIIPALIGAIAAVITILRFLFKAFESVFNGARAVVTAVINVIKNRIQAFKDGMDNLRKYIPLVWNAIIGQFNTAKNRIIAFFKGVGSWLVGAGKDMVMGFVNGIRGAIGNAAGAAADMAKSAWHAATSVLGIHSPSTVFKDIGMDVVRGFTEGVKNATTQKQLLNAIYKLTRDIQRSINAADISVTAKRATMATWNKRLANTTRVLNALELKRIGLQTKLAAAQKSVNDQIKTRNDLASKITESVAKSSDLSSLTDEQKTSTVNMVKAMRDRLQAVKTFQQQLRDLAQRGLDKQTIADLAQQGVDAAGSLVDTLAKGSTADLKTISSLQAQIRAIAGQTGTSVAGDLYNAGIKAGQGLIKGLQSQIGAITKQMAAIAAALVAQIKKQLGIKSPSRVFEKIGVNTARGYVNGYMARINRERDNLAAATMFQPAKPRTSMGNANGANAGVSRTYHQTINVATQEIDPRKQAAALGWELQGRLP